MFLWWPSTKIAQTVPRMNKMAARAKNRKKTLNNFFSLTSGWIEFAQW